MNNHRALIRACLSTCLLSSACGGADEENRTQTGSITGVTSIGSGTDGGTDTANDAVSDTSQVWDVGNGGTGMMSGGDDMSDGCKKVDLLFVIDNSGSMADEQQNLTASFPGFINAMQTELADTNGYHVGIISSDAYAYNQGGCTQEGALITQTGGANSSNSVCTPFMSGYRWMNESDDLASKFACAAQIGTGGDGNERPMQTLQAALANGINGPGGCNEGFLRPDALLVIVIITDEEDDHETDGCMQLPQPGSAGEPQQWFDNVVAAKGGIESNIVVLALVGPQGAQACPTLDKCTGGIIGADVCTRIIEFTGMFTHGFVGQVCAPTYDPFFQQAVGIIHSACDDYTPPG